MTPTMLLLALACVRPSDTYPVQIYGLGTELDEVLPAPEPMGGVVEYARFRLWGTNLGHGLTGFFGDSPRADGTSFVLGYGNFGYPRDPSFDRNSSFLSPGPPADTEGDACLSRLTTSGYAGITEYVDVGDHIALASADGTTVRLERDPSTHHRPAGESWYVGYGGTLGPVVQDHALLPDTWRSDEAVTIGFPGTLSPPDATIGAIPYPLTDGAGRWPADIEGLAIDDRTVRPPQHGWVYDDTVGDWVMVDDDVRYPGPWREPVTLTWAPSPGGQPLTVVLRYLGTGDEGACDCNDDCGAGFTCEAGRCEGEEGAGWNVLGELACTVADDGHFVLEPSMLNTLEAHVRSTDIRGAVLGVARMEQGTIEIADALSFNGRRVPITPARVRLSDILFTRLEAP